MEALNLSAAIDAGALADEADTSIGTSEQHAERIITAALPHILDALADKANSERVFGKYLPPVKEEALIVAGWLREQAEEVRQ